ncbi:hypothetical protein CHS0354_017911 [Potamilus streckersoni]|uniref:ADAMTS cysteine-rich domain-containing protein n=1 Tax=Potamilus streckersoni TaxID=2493646 RepID=A0AAE0W207_9BIVA|nr:hypothetical protein CHS0354_017911 [Potamilus streckersoni]
MQSILDETIQIKLAFVGLIVAKTPDDSYWTTGPSVTSSGGSSRRMLNASMALDNFQVWLDQNAVDLPAYDHAMLFTGYNLTYGGSAGNTGKLLSNIHYITGLAFKGSICRNISNSSVVEDVYDARTAIYAAQQLGRSVYPYDFGIPSLHLKVFCSISDYPYDFGIPSLHFKVFCSISVYPYDFGIPSLHLKVFCSISDYPYDFGIPSLHFKVFCSISVYPYEFGIPSLHLKVFCSISVYPYDFGNPSLHLKVFCSISIYPYIFGIPSLNFKVFCSISVYPYDFGIPSLHLKVFCSISVYPYDFGIPSLNLKVFCSISVYPYDFGIPSLHLKVFCSISVYPYDFGIPSLHLKVFCSISVYPYEFGIPSLHLKVFCSISVYPYDFGIPSLHLKVFCSISDYPYDFGIPSLHFKVFCSISVYPYDFGIPSLHLKVFCSISVYPYDFGNPSLHLKVFCSISIYPYDFGIPSLNFKVFCSISVYPYDFGIPSLHLKVFCSISVYPYEFGIPSLHLKVFCSISVYPYDFGIPSLHLKVFCSISVYPYEFGIPSLHLKVFCSISVYPYDFGIPSLHLKVFCSIGDYPYDFGIPSLNFKVFCSIRVYLYDVGIPSLHLKVFCSISVYPNDFDIPSPNFKVFCSISAYPYEFGIPSLHLKVFCSISVYPYDFGIPSLNFKVFCSIRVYLYDVGIPSLHLKVFCSISVYPNDFDIPSPNFKVFCSISAYPYEFGIPSLHLKVFCSSSVYPYEFGIPSLHLTIFCSISVYPYDFGIPSLHLKVFCSISVYPYELGIPSLHLKVLGARDDMDGNKCFSFSNYIMTSKVRLPLDRSVSSLSSFSPCSLSYFKQYIEKLNSEGVNCMLSTAARPWVSMSHQLTSQLLELSTNPSKFPGVLVNSVQFQDLTFQLAGMAYTGDQQCINSFGAGSFVCRGEITGDYQKICQGLLCHVPLTGFCDYILPADGTPCGNMSLCMKGKCVMFQSANYKLLDNCPFGDQPSSDCPVLIRSKPYSCYNNTVKFSCCASCTEIQENFLPGCEYGNRIDTCSMKDCTTGDKNYRDTLCCWTCANGPTPYSPPSIQYETGISPTTFDITDNSMLVSCYEQMEQKNTTPTNVSPNTETLPDVLIYEMSKTSPGILARSSPGILARSSPGILARSSPGSLSRTFMALTGFSIDTSSQKPLSLVSDKVPLELPIMVNDLTSQGSIGDADTIFPSSNTVTAAMTSTGSFNEKRFSRSNTFLSSRTSMEVSTNKSSVQTVASPIVKDLPLIVTRKIWGGLRPDGITTGSSAFVSLKNHPSTSPSNGATFFRSGDMFATTTITMPTTLNSITKSDASNSIHSSLSSEKVSNIMVNSQGQDLMRKTSTPRLSSSGSVMSIFPIRPQSTKLVTFVVTKSMLKSETLPIKGNTTDSSIKNSSQRKSDLTRKQGHEQSTVHLKLNPNPVSTDVSSNSAIKHAMDRGNGVHTGSDLLVASSGKHIRNKSRTTNGTHASSYQRGNRRPGDDSSQGLQDKMSKCAISHEQNSESMENQSIECEKDDGEPVIDRESVYKKLFPRKSQRHRHSESKQLHKRHTERLRWILHP